MLARSNPILYFRLPGIGAWQNSWVRRTDRRSVDRRAAAHELRAAAHELRAAQFRGKFQSQTMAPKAKTKSGKKAKILQQFEAEQLQPKPKGRKTWLMVCDCQEADCAECAPRNKVDSFEPEHAERRRAAPARFKVELSAPARAAVLKAKEETKPPKPPAKEETVVSPAPKPAVLGERKRVRGH